MADYQFVTKWRFPQPIERVWTAINAAEDYPRWWPDILYYECLTPENPRGVGARGKRAVRGFLPYKLHYTTTITGLQPPCYMTYDADGDLVGNGRFALQEIPGSVSNGSTAAENSAAGGAAAGSDAGQQPPLTEVTIYWNVSTRGRWLNRLAPLLKWLFAANHNYVMKRGQRGLAQWLNRNP